MPKIRITIQPGSDVFQMGFDMGWQDIWTAKYLAATDYASLRAFYNSHKITHVRFPGENSSQTFFYNDAIVDGKYYSEWAYEMITAYYQDKTIGAINQHVANQWTTFLKMAQGCALQPILPINMYYYTRQGQIYPIQELNQGPYADHGIDGMDLEEDRFTNPAKLQNYIEKQATIAHKYFTRVKWELGNEMYYWMGDTEYAEAVAYITTWIKALYPDDKILVSMAKGMVQSEHLDNWNVNLLSSLNSANVLDLIDFFVVHVYPTKLATYSMQAFSTDSIQTDINTRVEDTWFALDVMPSVKSYFDAYSPYSPKFSITEFNTYEGPYAPSQLHALLMLDILMKFRADGDIKSCTKHTGLNPANGLFLTKTAALQLSSGLQDINIAAATDSVPFPYVTPMSKLSALFLSKLYDTLNSYSLNAEGDGLEILVTKDGIKGRVHILNYKDTVATYDTTVHNGLRVTTYKLNDLTANTWDDVTNTSISVLEDSYDLPPHSLTIISNDVLFD